LPVINRPAQKIAVFAGIVRSEQMADKHRCEKVCGLKDKIKTGYFKQAGYEFQQGGNEMLLVRVQV